MKRRYVIATVTLITTWIIYEQATVYDTDERLASYAAEIITSSNKQLPPNSFTQDGCTLFPNRLPWHDFRKACLDHDVTYWAGGTDTEKTEADLKFYNSIKESGFLGPAIAPFMYISVSAFGDSWLTKLIGANWGYGHN